MAKTLSADPWIFTAIADAEGLGNGGSHNHPLWVHHLVFTVGSAADDDIEILDAAGGNIIALVDAPTADDSIWWDVGHWVPGLYVNQLPSTAKVYIHLGQPGR